MDLLNLSRLVGNLSNRLDIHPVFVGPRERRDAWQMKSWRPTGGNHVLLSIASGSVRLGIGSREWIMGPETAFLLSPEARPHIAFSSVVKYHEIYFKPC